MRNFLKRNWPLLCILAAGLAIRLLIALPGLLAEPLEYFSRPDTSVYLDSARALASDNAYLSVPGGEPTALRAPGFPWFVSLIFRICGGENDTVLAIVLTCVNALIALPVYWAGREFGGHRIGIIAALLITLNITVMAQGPMFLSDTFAAFFAAVQLWCFIRFWKRREIAWFFAAMAAAAGGALIRPINSAWFLPGLFLAAIAPGLPWRRKIAALAGGAVLFGGLLLPWMIRNAGIGAGYCIDTNTGAMYHQNGAMLLAEVNNSSYEEEKRKILREIDAEFADTAKYPDAASKVKYRMGKFRELIYRHPLTWLSQHLRPQILLPDAATFLEVLGITRSDRGTMDVLARDGLAAAVHHYFGDKIWLLWFLLPLLAIVAATYLGAAWTFFGWIRHPVKNYFAILLFLAFVEYYFFLPGPITAPRYQLPALPFLVIMAAAALPNRRKISLKTAVQPICKPQSDML